MNSQTIDNAAIVTIEVSNDKMAFFRQVYDLTCELSCQGYLQEAYFTFVTDDDGDKILHANLRLSLEKLIPIPDNSDMYKDSATLAVSRIIGESRLSEDIGSGRAGIKFGVTFGKFNRYMWGRYDDVE